MFSLNQYSFICSNMSFLWSVYGYMFDNSRLLASNEKNSHSNIVVQWEICGKGFAGKYKLAVHKVSYKTVECNICHQIVKKNSLNMHKSNNIS